MPLSGVVAAPAERVRFRTLTCPFTGEALSLPFRHKGSPSREGTTCRKGEAEPLSAKCWGWLVPMLRSIREESGFHK